MRRTRRRFRVPSATTRRRILAVTVAVVGAAALLAGGAVAFDQGAIISPSPTEVDAEPGETVTVSVGMTVPNSHGDGVEGIDLVARYDPEYVTITAVERGPWLEDDGVDVHEAETIDNSDGVATLEQWREPAETGATGSGELATVTVAVDEAAPAGAASISFSESTVEPAGDWPLPVQADRNATVAVDSAGDGDREPVGDAITGVGLTTVGAGLIALVYAALRRT